MGLGEDLYNVIAAAGRWSVGTLLIIAAVQKARDFPAFRRTLVASGGAARHGSPSCVRGLRDGDRVGWSLASGCRPRGGRGLLVRACPEHPAGPACTVRMLRRAERPSCWVGICRAEYAAARPPRPVRDRSTYWRARRPPSAVGVADRRRGRAVRAARRGAVGCILGQARADPRSSWRERRQRYALGKVANTGQWR